MAVWDGKSMQPRRPVHYDRSRLHGLNDSRRNIHLYLRCLRYLPRYRRCDWIGKNHLLWKWSWSRISDRRYKTRMVTSETSRELLNNWFDFNKPSSCTKSLYLVWPAEKHDHLLWGRVKRQICWQNVQNRNISDWQQRQQNRSYRQERWRQKLLLDCNSQGERSWRANNREPCSRRAQYRNY